MSWSRGRFAVRVATALAAFVLTSGRAPAADTWEPWTEPDSGLPANGIYAKLAFSGTNLYYASLHTGVFVADVVRRQFTPLPTNGLPSLLAADPGSVFDLWSLVVTPRGTVLIGLNPARQDVNTNTAPLLFRFDASNQQWIAANVHGRAYPYTAHLSPLHVGPDGTVWAGTGWYPYVLRSTNDGVDFTALDLNARVPVDHLPMPNGATTFGKLFGVLVTPSNEVLVGTETGGYLHSFDLGETWTSLAADFASSNSVNPLGRAGNAAFGGLDRHGNVLCVAPKYFDFPGQSNWLGCPLIAYRPADGAYWNAAQGSLPAALAPFRVVTTPAGLSLTTTTRTTNGLGGIFRSSDGVNWTLFNDGIPYMNTTGLPGQISGDGLASTGTLVLAAYGGLLWSFDTLPPAVTNHPPVALDQAVVTVANMPVAVNLSGEDPDGHPLTWSIEPPPQHGALYGEAPDLFYVPATNFTGNDGFRFTVADGVSTSPVAFVQIAVNSEPAGLPQAELVQPRDRSTALTQDIVPLLAIASDPSGIVQVVFYDGSDPLATVSNAPYATSWTNPAAGRHHVVAKAVNRAGARVWTTPAVVEVAEELPRVAIRATGAVVVVTWPLQLDGYLLESRADAAGPWSLVTNPPLDEAWSRHAVTIPADEPRQFRLWHP